MRADECKAVDKCAGYLLAYPSMLNFDEFLAKGLPIRSGVIEIEDACRHLLEGRLDITGARCSWPGAEAS